MNRKRKENESYDDYKDNLKKEDLENRNKLKGKLFHKSITYIKTYPFQIGRTYVKGQKPNI